MGATEHLSPIGRRIARRRALAALALVAAAPACGAVAPPAAPAAGPTSPLAPDRASAAAPQRTELTLMGWPFRPDLLRERLDAFD